MKVRKNFDLVSKRVLVVLASACLAPVAAKATTIADWTFESTAPTTAGPVSPESGAGSASGSHAGAAVYSSPVGDGSSKSYSANTWAPGDYWQFQASSSTLQNITLQFDQISSGTGPKDWTLEYSANGGAFTSFASYSVLSNSTPTIWSSASGVPASTMTYDLSGVSALNHDATITFRLVDADTTSAGNGTVGTAGTDRVDNVIISGSVPEPASLGLLGLSGLGLLARRRQA